jgi:arylsulfatase A
MKLSSLLRLTLFAAGLLSSFTNAHSASPPPNVLLIVSDDQGYGDFGFTGNKAVKTPHLDRLASESAVLRNFVVAPACSPTRASLLTGRQHLLTGTWGVGTRANMQRDEVRMPRFFQSAGYATGYFGKRDSIQWLEQKPWDNGCDEFMGVWGYEHRDAKFFTREGIVEKKGWTCDIDVDNALDFIKRQSGAGKPWWCAVAFILPHLPWQPAEHFSKPYRDAGLSPALAACYGSISQMDDATGRLLRGLKELGQDDNTLVVYHSDNGPSNKGLSDEDAKARNVASLTGSKATAWENGIRVPLLVRWPGRIPAGERRQFGSVEDVLPTLADFTALPKDKFPPHQPWHGISLRPVLEKPDAAETERTVFRVAISGDGVVGGKNPFIEDPAKLPMSAQHVTLRGPRFKFHQLAGGATALYDLEADPGETKDVSAEHPDIAKRYAAELAAEYQRIVSSGRALRMPVVKVGAKTDGMNQVDGSTAQSVTGSIRAAGAGVRGFLKAGDTAEYRIEVTQAGRYEVSIGGQRLDQAKGWQLHIGGSAFPLQTTEAERLLFGPAALTPGPATLRLSSTETSDSTATDAAHQPIVSRISFISRDKTPAAKPAAAKTTSAAPELRETFTTDLSKDWFWGLGTWTAKDGILRGFESGERRHGPVKLRRLAFTGADIRFDFRLEGKATFASFPINGTQERGHILNVVMARDQFRIIAHVKKGESVDLVREKITLADRDWHPVHIVLKGETLTVTFNDRTWTAKHPVIAEPKDNIGFGGDSGGPDGEKVGALEFRNFVLTQP